MFTPDIKAAEAAFATFMECLGLDLTDESLQNTPKRVAKMFINETCEGLFSEPPKMTSFPNDKDYHGMIVLRDLKIESLCEHHFQPIIGKCHIAYIPRDRVVGLSKFARIADYYARRPQLQERLTQQIFDHLKEVLETDDIAVVVEAEHMCMRLRGIKDPCSDTVTTLVGGLFMHSEATKQEFLTYIWKK